MSEIKEPERYDKEETKETYEEIYESGDFVKFPIADRKFIEALVSRYDIRAGESILDVPCGTGKYAKYFHDCGMDVTGVDISRNAIKNAIQEYPDVTFVLGDAMNPPFRDQTFDIVFCHGFSLFNESDLEATRQFMQVAADHLREDGLFVFGKTSSLSGKRTDSGRMDHTLKSYTEFFSSLNAFEVIGVHATAPHMFIPLGRFGFADIVTKMSVSGAKLSGLPLRVYVVLRKSDS